MSAECFEQAPDYSAASGTIGSASPSERKAGRPSSLPAGASSPICAGVASIAGESKFCVRKTSGSQPLPSSRRSASAAMSAFFRWSIICAVASPFASRTAVRICVFVTFPK
ncbi:hypothetical protein FEV16_14625 [Methylocystis sp. B8]|nr:hypothetical protein FEV16_14625 [Methylocystis sp. B8]